MAYVIPKSLAHTRGFDTIHPMTKPNRSVLFVCMGNICRSPTGEAVFRSLVENRGLAAEFLIDSAGTIGYHTGQRADPRMREAASARGYRLESRARQFDYDDFERFDLILAMDRTNYRDILSLDSQNQYENKVRLLCDFHHDSNLKDVPDPYYGGPQGFERVIDLVEVACEHLLDEMLDGRS